MDKACPPPPRSHQYDQTRARRWEKEEEKEQSWLGWLRCAALRSCFAVDPNHTSQTGGGQREEKVLVPGPAVPWLPLLRSPVR